MEGFVPFLQGITQHAATDGDSGRRSIAISRSCVEYLTVEAEGSASSTINQSDD